MKGKKYDREYVGFEYFLPFSQCFSFFFLLCGYLETCASLVDNIELSVKKCEENSREFLARLPV